jgi:hypothetical protein
MEKSVKSKRFLFCGEKSFAAKREPCEVQDGPLA